MHSRPHYIKLILSELTSRFCMGTLVLQWLHWVGLLGHWLETWVESWLLRTCFPQPREHRTSTVRHSARWAWWQGVGRGGEGGGEVWYLGIRRIFLDELFILSHVLNIYLLESMQWWYTSRFGRWPLHPQEVGLVVHSISNLWSSLRQPLSLRTWNKAQDKQYWGWKLWHHYVHTSLALNSVPSTGHLYGGLL